MSGFLSVSVLTVASASPVAQAGGDDTIIMGVRRAVVVTAEPFGGYHLTPFAPLVERYRLSHLLPYAPSAPSGTGVVPQGWDLTAVLTADVLIVTGGALSAWTSSVAAFAASHGVPVVFVQVAYLVAGLTPLPYEGGFVAATAASGHDAEILSHHLSLPPDRVHISGLPASDLLQPYDASGPLLVLPASDPETGDPEGLLLRAACFFRSQGLRVHARPHPRDLSWSWGGFPRAEGVHLPGALARSSAVAAHPGTSLLLAAAAGLPVLVMETPVLADVLSPAQRRFFEGLSWSGGGDPPCPGLPPRELASEALGPTGSAVRAVSDLLDSDLR